MLQKAGSQISVRLNQLNFVVCGQERQQKQNKVGRSVGKIKIILFVWLVG